MKDVEELLNELHCNLVNKYFVYMKQSRNEIVKHTSKNFDFLF